MPNNATASPTRAELVAVARTWLNVPFHHQGRSRAGVDCGGLVIAAAREAGLDVPEPGTYSMSPDPDVIRAALLAHCHPVSVEAALPGDILWLSFAGEPRHLAFATELGLLHAWAKPGKVVEHRIDAAWRRRIESAWRIRGIG